MLNSGAATFTAAEGEEVNRKAEMESPSASVPEGAAKCKKKKKRRKRKHEVSYAKENGTVEQEAASVAAAVLALDEAPKCKKKDKAKERGVVEQGTTTSGVSAMEGTPKCKEEEKMKEWGTVEQEATTDTVSEGTAKRKKKKKKKKKKKRKQEVANDKEYEIVEQEAASVVSAVLALEGTPKSKKKAKSKESVFIGEEAATTVVSALDETPKLKKKEKAKEKGLVEQGITTSGVSAREKTPKFTKEKAKESGIAEQEATTTTVLALEGTLKCKKKEKAKETVVDEPEPPTAVSALEGTKKYKIKGEKCNETGLAEQETAAAVIASEGTTKRKKKKLRKKFKMQEQLESTQALSGLVTVDKIVTNKPENGGTNGEGTSIDADVSMDPINAEDPNCCNAKDANDEVKCKAQEVNKNCSDKFSLLQEEGSEDRKIERKSPKRKRKRDASSRVSDISLQDGGRVADPCLDSLMGHDLNCTCASCLIQAHKEKVTNIFSPGGSLIRFQRKKLLILDLNGLLADITMDNQNAHMAHGRVRGKFVFRRPYYHEFLKFCFENFELGIWSSRKMENVNSVVNILMKYLKQYLLFVWDMSKCTFTGCNVIGDRNKPLVLKELKKLWNKEDPNLPWEQGEFSPSNTLLVDDSPYKALCNPPYTAIFPQPYSYHNQGDDNSLGPGGDLRVYLERLAAADDVQAFVRDNPFGQPSITESDPNWSFYAKIVAKVEQGFSLKWNHSWTKKPA